MTDPTSLDDLLAAARSCLDRVGPAAAHKAAAEGALLVDIRPVGLRRVDGEIPGAVIIDRNVLEWRLAPTSSHRIAEIGPDERTIIILCDEGYASSLAAATLQQLGLPNVTDLDGGFVAWRAEGLPICVFDDEPLTPGASGPQTTASQT